MIKEKNITENECSLIYAILKGKCPEKARQYIEGCYSKDIRIDDVYESVNALLKIGWTMQECADYFGYKNKAILSTIISRGRQKRGVKNRRRTKKEMVKSI